MATSITAAASRTGFRKIIATHSGKFHCDEALAVYMLLQTADFQRSGLVRTRDAAVLEKGDAVVDVGGVYDASTHRYDHHQRTFVDVWDETSTVRLSSAGLVYRHFGREVISDVAHGEGAFSVTASVKGTGGEEVAEAVAQSLRADGVSVLEVASHLTLDSVATAGFSWTPVLGRKRKERLTAAEIELIFQRVYTTFIKPLDAVDNGIQPYTETVPATPIYVERTTLPCRVSDLNTPELEVADEQLEPIVDSASAGAGRANTALSGAHSHAQLGQDERFVFAAQICGESLLHAICNALYCWMPARALLRTALASRSSVHASERIMVLDTSCAYGPHLYDALGSDPTMTKPWYVLFEDMSGTSWRIKAVSKTQGSFALEQGLPAPWRGVRDADLADLCSVSDAVFCHATGFIGAARSKEGAVRMATLAVEHAMAEAEAEAEAGAAAAAAETASS